MVEGITSLCKGFRATVSCANDGRKLGSLGSNDRNDSQLNRNTWCTIILFLFSFDFSLLVSCSDLRLPAFPHYPCNQGINFLRDFKAAILKTNCTHYLHGIHATPRQSQSCELPKDYTETINITSVQSKKLHIIYTVWSRTI